MDPFFSAFVGLIGFGCNYIGLLSSNCVFRRAKKINSFLLLNGRQTPLSDSKNIKVTKNDRILVPKMEVKYQISQLKKFCLLIQFLRLG